MLILTLFFSAGSNCSYKYLEQPPYHSRCNPYHSRQLNLQCTAFSRNSNFTIQWKWQPLNTDSTKPLQDVNIADLSTSNNTAFVVFSTLSVLSLSDSKAGTYWCQMVPTNVNRTLLRSSIYFLLISPAYNGLPACDNDKILKTSILKCADLGALVDNTTQPRNQAAVRYSTTPLPRHTSQPPISHSITINPPSKPTHNIATKTQLLTIPTSHHSPPILSSQLLTNGSIPCNFCFQRDATGDGHNFLRTVNCHRWIVYSVYPCTLLPQKGIEYVSCTSNVPVIHLLAITAAVNTPPHMHSATQ